MRILVGTVEIAGQLPIYAEGFRQLGHQVTTVVHSRNIFYPDLEYDVDISPPKPIDWPDAIKQSSSFKVRIPRGIINRSLRAPHNMIIAPRLLQLIANHDLFIFQWAGQSLSSGNREYPLLKRLGKRIVAVCNGDDIRHWSSYNQQHAALNMKVNLREYGSFYKNDRLTRPLRNLRMAERYADLILSVPNQSGLAVRPYVRFNYPLDLSKFRFDIAGRDVPVVVHAPSVKSIKGTEAIMAALDRLRSEGVAFELQLLHGVPNSQVINALIAADVLVEQLPIPSYGLTGAEAMATGCALATCSREEFEPIPPNRPIWHIDAANIYDQLKRLLTDKELRIRLAREGRQYVEKHHDNVEIARQIIERLNCASSMRYDFYPSFFARRYRLPEGQTIPSYLRRMTTQIVQTRGLPEGVDPQDMVDRGLMSAEGLDRSAWPRWQPSPSPAT